MLTTFIMVRCSSLWQGGEGGNWTRPANSHLIGLILLRSVSLVRITHPLLQSPIAQAHFSTSPLCLCLTSYQVTRGPALLQSYPLLRGGQLSSWSLLQALSAQAVHSDRMPSLFPILQCHQQDKALHISPSPKCWSVSMLTSFIPEFLLPLGSGPSTWVQSTEPSLCLGVLVC